MMLTVLKFYLVINLLLILTYVLFKAIRKFSESSSFRLSYLKLNRMAQMFVITAILSPVVLTLAPRTAVPNFNVRIPIAESLSVEGVGKNAQTRKISESIKPTTPRAAHAVKTDIVFCVFIVIAFGVFLAFTRLTHNLIKLRRTLKAAILIRQVGRVRILVSESIKIPFSTLACVTADVVLPSESVRHTRDLNIIIRHELQHHRNGDTFWVLFVEMLVSFFYLNPLIYLWKREMTEVQEFACDEALISQMRVSARDYGQCLVKIAESAQGFSPVQVGTTCMGAGPKSPQQLKSFLRRRIEVLQDHKKISRKNLIGLVTGAIGLIITAGVAYGAQKTLRSEEISKPNSGVAKFDTQVQKVTETILSKYVTQFKARGGFIVVGDSQTGRVLAVANQISNAKPQTKSWALSYELEPASVMKGVITASAIDRAKVRIDEKFDCEKGRYVYGDRTYRDWKAFDTLTATESVSVSSNICGIKIGERLGANGLEASLKDFGFGPNGTAATFPEAKTGHYPKAGEIPDTSYVPLIATGYTETPGFQVTPLEVLQAYGAIANDGKLMKPIMADASDSSAVVVRQAISLETSQQIKAILIDVVKNGTGKNARSALYTTAGKTSTAYRPDVPEHSSLGGERGIAGFVGFAPVQNSRIVVYVAIFDPTNSADKNPHGSEHGAPVFKEVVESVLQLMNVAPDNKVTL